MYTYMYMFMYIRILIYIYIYTCTSTEMFVYKYIYIYIFPPADRPGEQGGGIQGGLGVGPGLSAETPGQGQGAGTPAGGSKDWRSPFLQLGDMCSIRQVYSICVFLSSTHRLDLWYHDSYFLFSTGLLSNMKVQDPTTETGNTEMGCFGGHTCWD